MGSHVQNILAVFTELGVAVNVVDRTARLIFPAEGEVSVDVETAYWWARDVAECAPWEAWLESSVASGEGALAVWQRRPAGVE